jgi:hypothetical protein
MNLRRITLALCLLVLAASAVAAQDVDLSTTYNNAVSFQYPAGWNIEEDTDFVRITGETPETGQVSLTLYTPDYIAAHLGSQCGLLFALDELLEEEFDFTAEAAEQADLTEHNEVAVAAIASADGSQRGYAFLFQLHNGNLVFAIGLAEPENAEASQPLFLDILRTYDNPDSTLFTALYPDSSGASNPVGQTLDSYNQGWEAAIDELRGAGVIGDGGSLVLEQESAYIDGIGNFYQPVASVPAYSDFVMAGEVSLTTGSDENYESCGIEGRVQVDRFGSTSIWLEAGLDSESTAYYADAMTSLDECHALVLADEVDFNQPHHFLMVVQNDRMMVYMDGRLIGKNLPVENRSGTFAITLFGEGTQSRCDARDIWVYEVPYIEPGACEITAISNARKRTGPGTGFSQSGLLVQGASQAASVYSLDGNGTRWWQLDDETWVRDDLVNAAGECSNIPEQP